MSKLSFIIPCYGSENTIESVVNEIRKVINDNQYFDYEIILVNDSSPDNVWERITKLSAEDGNIKAICLAKNFGQHAALMAGYANSLGDIVISMDDDGQTPIDEVNILINKLQDGYDVVYAYFEEKKRKFYRRFGTWMSDKMAEQMIGMPKGNRGSSFFVMRKYVVQEIIRYDNAYAYIPGLIYRTTKKVACLPTHRRERLEGVSGYSLKKLLKLWFNGFSAFSAKPLEVSAYIGAIISIIGFVYAIFIVVTKIVGFTTVEGWSSLLAVNLIIGGMTLLSLGLIGEYVGRIYISLNKSPLYVIRDTINIEKYQVEGDIECPKF